MYDKDCPHQVSGHAEIIRTCWYQDTALPRCDRQWSPDNPALGQSDVTALLVQRLFRGEIRRTSVVGHGVHFFNVLPDGTKVDLTRSQFPCGTVIGHGERVDTDRLLGESESDLPARFKKFAERYEFSLMTLHLGC